LTLCRSRQIKYILGHDPVLLRRIMPCPSNGTALALYGNTFSDAGAIANAACRKDIPPVNGGMPPPCEYS
jgi:hypothetical protein